MSAFAWAALIGSLACVPIADPITRRWCRARLRMRRMAALRVNLRPDPIDEQRRHLQSIVDVERANTLDFTKRGHAVAARRAAGRVSLYLDEMNRLEP